jgi:copper chaperone CopZ
MCCKDRIEQEMQFTKGVRAVDLDIESGILTVTFKSKRTDVDKLRKVVSLIGYNADDVKANRKAHDKLPSCCQHLDFKEE